MYDELYNIWKKERETPELQKLPKDFYLKIAEYFKKILEEGRMLDKKTAKASLLKTEKENVKRLISALAQIRYKKIVAKASSKQKVPHDTLLENEEKVYSELLSQTENYQNFLNALLEGRLIKPQNKNKRMVVLRFSQSIPEIVGADMKTYGPFKAEDVASIPLENAKILVKQKLAYIVNAD